MNSASSITFAPLVPWGVIAVLAGAGVALIALAFLRRLPGAWLRAAAALVLLTALANPALQTEERDTLTDIVFVMTDASASQGLSDRTEQTDAAVQALVADVEGLGNTEVRRITVGDDTEDAGTLLMGALTEALTEEPQSRVAGALIVTDGVVHDAPLAPAFPAPVQVLLTGRESDWDRRLVIEAAPAFAILGEEITLRLRIEDQGNPPPGTGEFADLSIGFDDAEPETFSVAVGSSIDLPITVPKAGLNVVSFTTPEVEAELTPRNNAAVVQINGVRDRLRVLLVSGEPHAGERTWRNLLKADAAVDLVHFTILRPPEKQDGVPSEELSLIAFPTRELFIDKIKDFDLIIFDRYSRRGILPAAYMDNIVSYVEEGGAVLVSNGPEFAGADSIFYSSLGTILPGAPTAQVIEEGFRPMVSERGHRHPVTQGLEAFAPQVFDQAAGEEAFPDAPAETAPESDAGGVAATDDEPAWGRWFRIVEVEALSGETVMTGPGERPLLILDRVGEGRVALLASDHAWLWTRGFEGGGPQQELLRRLAHWLMKEPQLEEEALVLATKGDVLSITRRTMQEGDQTVTITGPGIEGSEADAATDGTEPAPAEPAEVAPDETDTVELNGAAPEGPKLDLPLVETAPGTFTANWRAPEQGLFRVTQGDLAAVAVIGPAAPKEFEQTIATAEPLAVLTGATNGTVTRLEDGLPDVRTVRAGRDAHGRGWIGITPREAWLTTGIKVTPLLPVWALLALATGLMIGAWLREGRGRRAG